MKEFKYETEDYPPYCTVGITHCTYYEKKMIGSFGCIDCKYHKSDNRETKTVQCTKDEEKAGE